MSNYYCFTNKQKGIFHKVSSLAEALVSDRGDNLFKRVQGVPNPWFLHPIENGKVLKDIVLKGDQYKEWNGSRDHYNKINKKEIKEKMSVLDE